MSPLRMTRAESRAQTRSRLLDAARDVFLRRGFEGASLEEISEAAGYTRGAVYSNFEDKEELFLALVEEHFAQETGGAEQIFASEPTPEQRIVALQRWHTGHMEDERAWTMLILEFWLYALRNADVRPRLAAAQDRARAAVGRMIRRQLGDLGITTPISIDDLASIVIALDCGLAGQHHVDPGSVSAGLFGTALALFTAGLANTQPAPRAKRRHSTGRRAR